jgi:hypothetical protein
MVLAHALSLFPRQWLALLRRDVHPCPFNTHAWRCTRRLGPGSSASLRVCVCVFVSDRLLHVCTLPYAWCTLTRGARGSDRRRIRIRSPSGVEVGSSVAPETSPRLLSVLKLTVRAAARKQRPRRVAFYWTLQRDDASRDCQLFVIQIVVHRGYRGTPTNCRKDSIIEQIKLTEAGYSE